MAGVAVERGGNVGGRLAHDLDVVVAIAARPNDLRVIEALDRKSVV